jgi:hypothetical protein
MSCLPGKVLVHRLHQREIFSQRHGDAGLLQLVEEIDEHILPAGQK